MLKMPKKEKKVKFANIVDSDEAAHPDLHCLPYSLGIFSIM